MGSRRTSKEASLNDRVSCTITGRPLNKKEIIKQPCKSAKRTSKAKENAIESTGSPTRSRIGSTGQGTYRAQKTTPSVAMYRFYAYI
jgi:hypothetical protein